jgi:RNA polymerase sigma factor (sigma-70 family)
VERHSGQLIATARRYSLSAEDAEDAYQRGLEIMLTRAPSSLGENELVPWLKTVVKHEAFAIRKQRQRAEIAGDPELAGTPAPAAHEQAERHERLRVGIEAISRLKPQEVRCLLLRAEGYSYKQICDETGWTYTKVNRCVTEGRRAFLERVAGIESGAECERLAPLLSRLVDGEASPEDVAALRPHLRGCLACRARLRDYREAPARVAALVPLLAAPHLLSRALHGLRDLFAQIGAQKTAAVVALAAAVAVGGGGVVQALHESQQAPAARVQHAAPSHPSAPPAPASARSQPALRPLHPRSKRIHRARPRRSARPAAHRAPVPPRPPAARSSVPKWSVSGS